MAELDATRLRMRPDPQPCLRRPVAGKSGDGFSRDDALVLANVAEGGHT